MLQGWAHVLMVREGARLHAVLRPDLALTITFVMWVSCACK